MRFSPAIEPDLIQLAIICPDFSQLLQDDRIVGYLCDVHLTRSQRSILYLEHASEITINKETTEKAMYYVAAFYVQPRIADN